MWIKTSQCFAEVDPLDGAIYSMPYGTVMNVDAETGQEYIDQGLAEVYTGVGSEYDFSLMTLSCSGNQTDVAVFAPFIVDGVDGSFIKAMGSFSEGEAVYNVAMYKGACQVYVMPMPNLTVSVSGNATLQEDAHTIDISGDCTISVTVSS